jgi:hypothetical protein
MIRSHVIVPACIALVLTSCARPTPAGNSLSALDNELINAAEAGDPQVADAIAAANGSAPAAAARPDDDCRAGGRNGTCTAAATVGAPGCGTRFALGLGWATRLPAGLELYPGAKVIEAAGNDEGDCHIRIVSYVSDAPAKELVDWYEGASKAGFETEHSRSGREDIVTGIRQPQGDAFHATVAPDAGGSAVNLIVNHGS